MNSFATCPWCKTEMLPSARVCRSCGSSIGRDNARLVVWVVVWFVWACGVVDVLTGFQGDYGGHSPHPIAALLLGEGGLALVGLWFWRKSRGATTAVIWRRGYF